MLILKRKVGDSITINDDVEIMVLGFEGGAIRLGVTALNPHRTESRREEAMPQTEKEKNVLVYLVPKEKDEPTLGEELVEGLKDLPGAVSRSLRANPGGQRKK